MNNFSALYTLNELKNILIIAEVDLDELKKAKVLTPTPSVISRIVEKTYEIRHIENVIRSSYS
jgi:hypothetical protein